MTGRSRLVVGLGVVAVLAGGLAVFRQSSLARVGVDMNGRIQQGRPWFGLHDVGFGLHGEVVTTPVADWSFVNAVRSVKIQTTPWWRIPYTVNTSIAASLDGQRVYLFSDYLAPAPPSSRTRRCWRPTRQVRRRIAPGCTSSG